MRPDYSDSCGRAALPRGPRIRPLSARQSGFVLARNRVGRVVFIMAGRPEVLPVHYVFANDVIIGRTAFRARVLHWLQQSEVVFEVDESNGLLEWRSVIVRGVLRILPETGTQEQRETYQRSVAAFRTLVPDAMTERDPTPDRRVLFRIEPAQLSGREAGSSVLRRSGEFDRGY